MSEDLHDAVAGRGRLPAIIADASDAGDASWARDWRGRHAVDLRLSLPWPSGRVYVALVAGREARRPARRAAERRKHPLATIGNGLTLLMVGTVTLFFFFAMLHLLIVKLLQPLLTGA